MKFDIFEIFECGSVIFDLVKEFSGYLPIKYLKKRREKKKARKQKRRKKADSPYMKRKSRKRFKKNLRSSFERANWFLYQAESFWYQVMEIEKKL
ncbi:MAG: hypothetical protein R3Y53_04430 [Bacillota bacterium]